MSIKDKIKSVLSRATGKKAEKAKKRSALKDSELGAEEVTREEVFPKNTRAKKSNGATRKTCNAAKRPASKRTRPTNDNYKMINPDDDSCDCGKS